MATIYAGLRRTADNDGCLCRLHRPDDDLRAMVGFHPCGPSLRVPRLLDHHAAPATQPGPTSKAATERHLTQQRDHVAPASGALISGTTSHAERRGHLVGARAGPPQRRKSWARFIRGAIPAVKSDEPG